MRDRPFAAIIRIFKTEKEQAISAKIPDSHKDLLEEAIPVTIATIMPNGDPQLSVYAI